MKTRVLCVGAAHIDRKAKAQSAVQLGTSNPVSMQSALGGVARNVAENLARLGCKVALLSRVGNDQEGAWVRASSESLGIDTGLTRHSHVHATASYTALINPRGEMVVGLADMDIYNELTPSLLTTLAPSLQTHGMWFVDTNLSKESLHYLLTNRTSNQPVFVDPVSVAKAAKIRGLLSHVDYLFPSRDEAESLTGISIHNRHDAIHAAEELCRQGVKMTVITLGEDGVCAVGDGCSCALPAIPTRVVDVTGAGDALVAGVIFGLMQSLPLRDAIRLGVAAATMTIETTETVNPHLTSSAVFERAKETQLCT